MGVDVIKYLFPLGLICVCLICLCYDVARSSDTEPKSHRGDAPDRNVKSETPSTEARSGKRSSHGEPGEAYRTSSKLQDTGADGEHFASSGGRDDVFERRSFHKKNRPHGTFCSSHNRNGRRRRKAVPTESITIFVALIRNGIDFGGRAGRRKRKDNR